MLLEDYLRGRGMTSLTFLMDVGTTLGLLDIIPQMYRAFRTRDVLGDVSLTS